MERKEYYKQWMDEIVDVLTPNQLQYAVTLLTDLFELPEHERWSEYFLDLSRSENNSL